MTKNELYALDIIDECLYLSKRYGGSSNIIKPPEIINIIKTSDTKSQVFNRIKHLAKRRRTINTNGIVFVFKKRNRKSTTWNIIK